MSAHGTRVTHFDVHRKLAPRTFRARLICRSDRDGTTTWDYYYNYDGRLYGIDKDSSSVQTNTYNPDGTRRSIGNGGNMGAQRILIVVGVTIGGRAGGCCHFGWRGTYGTGA
ncbi:MAG TPA: hypothetical protein VM163_14005 [bacterium]|nr:hypothetical protein [bacterium]